MVLYNAVQAAQNAGPGPLSTYLVLQVAGNQLSGLCHNAVQHRLLAMPGRNVSYVPGKIRPEQVLQHRASYINALLIQRAGTLIPGGCNLCCSKRGFSPFTECRHVPGEFGGSCGNCKWPDHSKRCDHGAGNDGNDDDDGDDSDDVPLVPRRRTAAYKQLLDSEESDGEGEESPSAQLRREAVACTV
jgi:hypothetical protein